MAVKTIASMAQWTIDNFQTNTSFESVPSFRSAPSFEPSPYFESASFGSAFGSPFGFSSSGSGSVSAFGSSSSGSGSVSLFGSFSSGSGSVSPSASVPVLSFESVPFKMGRWNWYLQITREGHIRLCLKTSQNLNPTARLVFRVFSEGRRLRYISPVYETLLQSNQRDGISWHVGGNKKPCWSVGAFGNYIIIEVEFLDLKISSSNGEEVVSIWPGDRISALSPTTSINQFILSRMLNEAIHTDVTINTEEGSLRAHKAVLSASSPVFESMFIHNFKEKESANIDLKDMSHESYTSLVQYLYGTIKLEDLWMRRRELIQIANKYDIPKLKEICEESLLEDINSENVLERLHDAWLYQLNKLKKGCLSYLFDFGKIRDVKDNIGDFFRQSDKEFILEMFQESIALWVPA